MKITSQINKKIIYGYQAVLIVLKNKYQNLGTLFITKNKYDNKEISSEIKKYRKLQLVSSQELDKICNNINHNGVAIQIQEYFTNKQLTELNNKILVLDGITDSGNLGAIIRSAAVFGYDLILPKHNSATINGAVCKNSAGGIVYVNIHVCDSLLQAIEMLKKRNYFIIGTTEKIVNLPNIYNVKNTPEKIVLIMGSEDQGIRNSLMNTLDLSYTILGNPDFNVLNVSVASAISMFNINNILSKNK